jgi:DNA helicase-2/ATP-dependent DNA helicase PcrA
MEEYLKGLNEKQYEGATCVDGRIRLVAGAGAGKTKTLTCRYAYLMKHENVNPDNILCLTFTNKAANEMRQRIEKMIGHDFASEFICTIHSFCVKVLRKDIYRLGFPMYFNILDEEDKKLLGKEIIEDMGYDKKSTNVKNILEKIERYKTTHSDSYIKEFFTPRSLNNMKRTKTILSDDEKIFIKYCEKQIKNFSLDFDDLIYFALHLLLNFDDVREYWRDKFHYIMVDEAQDCNKHDWQILEILASKHKNLYIIGDDNQSIYKFRGSDVKGFINFKNDKTILLTQNYRSTKNILDVANSIIKNNTERVDKDLFTEKQGGVTVTHYHGNNIFTECNYVCDEIRRIKREDRANYSDFTILYRNNAMSREIEQALIKKGLPYKIFGGIRFYERKEIKDAISFLKLINNNDNLSFKRVINEPSRKIGKVFIDKVEKFANEKKITLYESLKRLLSSKTLKNDAAIEFIQIIDEAKTNKNTSRISDLLNTVLNDTGYMDMLREDVETDRLDNLNELLNSIIYYERQHVDEEDLLDKFLQDISLYTNTDNDDNGDVVKVMTMHQSKGLEFPNVFVINVFEGGIPSHKACETEMDYDVTGREEIEEERRLMYVACTRAEKRLYLTESEGYSWMSGGDKIPSRFIDEIPTNLINYKKTEYRW